MSAYIPLTINKLVIDSNRLSREKGWWKKDRNIASKLMLIVSEIAEALEEFRRLSADGNLSTVYYSQASDSSLPKPEGFGVELADAMIRIADLAGHLNINLESAILEKHKFNESREYLHGGKRC